MAFNIAAYTCKDTTVHALDARVKVLLMLAYSITLFFVESWPGLLCCAVLFVLCCALARLSLARAAVQLAPLLLILAFTLLANSFSLNVWQAAVPSGLGAVSSGLFAGMQPIALLGSFGFVPQGFGRGLFYVLRIALLVLASLVVTTTTSNMQMARAFEQFLRPFARFGLPAHDIATTVSIALRFIPETIDEFQNVKAAQASRGALFDCGGLLGRLRAYSTVLIPMFVGLFRRADNLALAMDARCYGMAVPGHLHESRLNGAGLAVLFAGLALCAALALLC